MRVRMSPRDELLEALKPLTQFIATLQPGPQAAAALAARFPVEGREVQKVKGLVRQGVEQRWLCEKENAGVRFGRVLKGDAQSLSIDAVHMSGAGAGHTHPAGEFDLCFAVSGGPRFDGQGEGWTVYAPNTWHVPTVAGGVMDILYFLPGGAIRFEAMPEGATAVGLQAKGR
jgi:hypothetical protein